RDASTPANRRGGQRDGSRAFGTDERRRDGAANRIGLAGYRRPRNGGGVAGRKRSRGTRNDQKTVQRRRIARTAGTSGSESVRSVYRADRSRLISPLIERVGCGRHGTFVGAPDDQRFDVFHPFLVDTEFARGRRCRQRSV